MIDDQNRSGDSANGTDGRAEAELERLLDRMADQLCDDAEIRELRGAAIEPVNLFTQHPRVKNIEERITALSERQHAVGNSLRAFFDALTVYMLKAASESAGPDWMPPISDEKRDLLDGSTRLIETLEEELP